MRITRWKHALWASVIASMVSSTAFAADPTGPAVDPAEQFKVLSAKAETAFQARQYQAAIDAYLEAYGILPSPDVLYNIAYIYDHNLSKSDLAQDFYRKVIRMPDSSKEIMELSMKRLAELEAKDNARATLLRNNNTPPDTNVANGGNNTPPNNNVGGSLKRPDDDGPSAAPWVLIGLGGASVIGAGVLAIVAQGSNDKFKRSDDIEEMRSLEDDGKTQALTADILGIGGGALIATGIIVYFATRPDDPKPDVTFDTPVKPLLSRGAIGLTWETNL